MIRVERLVLRVLLGAAAGGALASYLWAAYWIKAGWLAWSWPYITNAVAIGAGLTAVYLVGFAVDALTDRH